MSDIRWDILQPVDVGARFQQGYDHAQQNALQRQEVAYQLRERQRTEGLRNALTGAINPATGQIDYTAARRAYLGAGDAQGAVQIDSAERAQQQARLEQNRDRIIMGGRIFRSLNVNDEASYQRALGIARQAGMDTTDVPPHYQPEYVQGVIATGQQLAARATGPTVLAEGATLVDPATGQTIASGNARPPRYYSVPPGGTLQIDPSYQGPGAPSAASPPNLPHASTPEDIAHLPPGSQFIAPDGTVRTVPGGAPQPQAAGTFP